MQFASSAACALANASSCTAFQSLTGPSQCRARSLPCVSCVRSHPHEPHSLHSLRRLQSYRGQPHFLHLQLDQGGCILDRSTRVSLDPRSRAYTHAPPTSVCSSRRWRWYPPRAARGASSTNGGLDARRSWFGGLRRHSTPVRALSLWLLAPWSQPTLFFSALSRHERCFV